MRNYLKTALFAAVLTLAASVFAGAQVKRSPFDVTNYTMDVTLQPAENKLIATADVTFTPQEDTRNVTFELNGSLKVRGGEAIGEIAATSNAHLPLAVALASMIGAWLHELKESRSGCGAFVGCC